MKYTQTQLALMAREALAARDSNDPRWLDLVINLALRTGLPVDECVLNITELAK